MISSLRYRVQATAYSMDNRALSLGVQRPWREADRSPKPSAGVKICECKFAFPHISSWRGA
jgi:hypothetical protein